MNAIIDALLRQARLDPRRRAVTGSRDVLDMATLGAEVARLSRLVDGGVVLGSLMSNSPAWVVTDLAAMHARVTHVPLPGFFSDSQLQHALDDAGVNTVITDDPERIERLACVLRRETLLIAGREYTRLRLRAGKGVTRDEIAKVTYTSGTTGTPRGVCLSQEAIENVALSLVRASGATRRDRALVLLPLSILLENISTVYVPLLCGAEIQVPDSTETGIRGSSDVDADQLARALRQYQPTALVIPPGLLKLLNFRARHELLPSTLRFIAVGGAPVSRALLEEATSYGLPVYQGYGLSEAGSVVALNTPQHNRPGSVGRLLPHLRADISTSGEICVQGHTCSGYLGSASRDPSAVLPTGDTGYFDDDGYLYVTGRMRERIITAYGRNVSPEWVEAELAAHSEILQAMVDADGQSGLRAVLVPAGMDSAALARAVREINSRLPDYARINRWVVATHPFSVSNGTAMPTGSPCRSTIRQQYFSRQPVTEL